MKVVVMDIKRVVPYARNPRKNQAAIANVAASIREFGFRQPIVVDSEMVIVVGHTRYLAALQLGLRRSGPRGGGTSPSRSRRTGSWTTVPTRIPSGTTPSWRSN
jgi:hypothetical protein